MSKDRVYTTPDFHGKRLAVFIVRQRNPVLGKSRWAVFSEYPQRGTFLLKTSRWRWVARRSMRRIAGVSSWEDVK